jgi:eukaryotic-like serine/threonine-protein kinase
MRPCECLVGLEVEKGWKVVSAVYRPATSTGGHFSMGYLARNKDGREGYLKALDFSAAFQSPDPSLALEALTKAYNFERKLLNKCKEKTLDRVALPIDSGKVKVPGDFQLLGTVMYIIFELAEGDIRNEVIKWKNFDLAWALRSLHQTTTGLSQLHSAGIAHQDIKPSNVLVFPADGTKVSDLGRASSINEGSELDLVPIPGDYGYAPPEQRYNWKWSPDFSKRYMADLYLLGSLIFFYFLNASATQAMVTKMVKKMGKTQTNGDFEHDLPYIQEAFSESLVDLSESVGQLAGSLSDEIVMIAQQLCEPDPRRRGDPMVLAAVHIPKYDLQAYISRFDRLATIAESRMI